MTVLSGNYGQPTILINFVSFRLQENDSEHLNVLGFVDFVGFMVFVIALTIIFVCRNEAALSPISVLVCMCNFYN